MPSPFAAPAAAPLRHDWTREELRALVDLPLFELIFRVGYDFGPVDIQAWVTQSVFRQDAIDGLTFWSRIGFKLWGPEAPKPLVAKN
jgi:hypothetical protein